MVMTWRSSVSWLTERVLGMATSDAGLEHGRGEHEDEQEDEDDVDERGDVDLG